MLVLLALSVPAFAQQEVCSAGSFNHDLLASNVSAAEARLTAGDGEGAREVLSATHFRLPCLDHVVRPVQLARFSRALARAFFFDQDVDSTIRWGHLADDAAGDLPWPDDVPASAPIRVALGREPVPAVGGPDDKGLLVPKGGAVFLDGRFLTAPRASVEVPHLMQVTDKKGVVTSAWWQDGAAFPELALGPVGPPPTPPKWYLAEAEAAIAAATADATAKAPQIAAVTPAPPPVPPPPVAIASADPPPKPPPSAPVAAPPVAPPPSAPVAATPPPKPPPSAPVAAVPATPPKAAVAYVDPFAAAKARAIAHEVSMSESVDDKGTRTVVRTEVTKLAIDPSDGKPVLVKHYTAFLDKHPEWKRDAAMSAGLADKDYLAAWSKAMPANDVPMVGVSFNAARAYCASYGNDIVGAQAKIEGPLPYEWRLAAGLPAIADSAKAKVSAADPSHADAKAAFRCTRE